MSYDSGRILNPIGGGAWLYANLPTGTAAATIPAGTQAYCSDLATTCVYNGTSWSPLSTGTTNIGGLVSGSATAAVAAANTAIINAALALGGHVSINTAGVYTIGASQIITRASGNTYSLCLSIPSNTELSLGIGVTLQVLAGLVNPVAIQNSNAPSGGTNVNITINGPGAIDGNYPNCTRTDGTDFCCILFWMQNVTNFQSTNLQINNPTAWSTGFGGCSQVNITGISFTQASPQVNQDGLHFQGKNTDIQVNNVFGATGDALVALVTNATALYSATLAGPGPISDVVIDGVVSLPTFGSRFLTQLQDDTTYPISRVSLNNLSGPYTYSAIWFSADGVGGTGQFNDISIDNLHSNVLTGVNPTQATIQVETNMQALTISNWTRVYSDGNESTKRACFLQNNGSSNAVMVTNMSVRDTCAAGAGVGIFSVLGNTAVIGDLTLNNVEVVVTVSTGSDSLVKTAGSGSVSRLHMNNVAAVKLSNLVNNASTGAGLPNGAQLHNIWSNNAQAALILMGASPFPYLQITDMYAEGTNGGAAGIINVNGLTGTTLIQMKGCVFANGGNAVIVRAASETIRVQTIDTPVPSTVLTPSRGDVILDSANNNDPYRYNGSAWVAM